VLHPGGTFLSNVWDDLQHNDFAAVVTEALEQIFPDNPPRFLARTPHGYHDADEIWRDLGAAGLSQVSIETLECTSRCDSPRDAAVGYCQGTPLYGRSSRGTLPGSRKPFSAPRRRSPDSLVPVP
jgi:hypothetical protein